MHLMFEGWMNAVVQEKEFNLMYNKLSVGWQAHKYLGLQSTVYMLTPAFINLAMQLAICKTDY